MLASALTEKLIIAKITRYVSSSFLIKDMVSSPASCTLIVMNQLLSLLA